MRNKILTALTLILIMAGISSCASTKKYGCPTVSVETKKFKA